MLLNYDYRSLYIIGDIKMQVCLNICLKDFFRNCTWRIAIREQLGAIKVGSITRLVKFCLAI